MKIRWFYAHAFGILSCCVLGFLLTTNIKAAIVDNAGENTQIPGFTLNHPQTVNTQFATHCVRWDTRCWLNPICVDWAHNPAPGCYYCRKVNTLNGTGVAKFACNPLTMLSLKDQGYYCAHSHVYNANSNYGACLRWNREERCYRLCMQWRRRL